MRVPGNGAANARSRCCAIIEKSGALSVMTVAPISRADAALYRATNHPSSWRSMRHRISTAAFALALASFSGSAIAQASPTVPANERVYRDIDRLAASGLIDTIIVGTRPYSQREVLRLLHEAQRNLGRLGGRAAWATAVVP